MQLVPSFDPLNLLLRTTPRTVTEKIRGHGIPRKRSKRFSSAAGRQRTAHEAIHPHRKTGASRSQHIAREYAVDILELMRVRDVMEADPRSSTETTPLPRFAGADPERRSAHLLAPRDSAGDTAS